LVLASWFPLVIPVAATPAAAADACVACHTDAGKLKALTPPDPPSAETGEG
jgi:mono/diheme cytochrome c family protein